MKNQRGVAIVLAMGVVALAAMAATAILVSQSTWARQRQLSSEHAQALLIVQAGVDWVRAVLSDDKRRSPVDHLGEPWALRLPPMPVDNGELAGHIEDQQGAFNLNNLVRDGKLELVQMERYKRLLTLLDLSPDLAPALADWLDSDSEPQPQGGAEDAYYLSLDPPYLPANRPLLDIEDLALVRGYDAAARARLKPYVTALPVAAAINVNTASAEVLAAIVEGLDLAAARDIVAARERVYFRDLADFNARLPKGGQVPDQAAITVSSEFFLAVLRVSFGDAQASGLALLARPDIKWPKVLWCKTL